MAEEKKREPRHKRMYKASPKLERNEKGAMEAVKPSEKEADKEQSGTDGVKMTEHGGEALPPHVRHAHERRDMHNRHEMEHSVHDHAKAGSKKEMHTRHEKDMKDMHSKHEKEIEGVESKDQDVKENKKGEKKEEKGE